MSNQVLDHSRNCCHLFHFFLQNSISELGYLEKIANILNYPDADIKKQTALLVNNLSLNEKNQNVLKVSIEYSCKYTPIEIDQMVQLKVLSQIILDPGFTRWGP